MLASTLGGDERGLDFSPPSYLGRVIMHVLAFGRRKHTDSENARIPVYMQIAIKISPRY